MNKVSTMKRDRVLLDANIWIQHPLLRSNLGEALLFRLNGNAQSIVLPSVVEAEAKKHTLRLALGHYEKINVGFDRLEPILGSNALRPAFGERELTAAIDERFAQLSPMLFRVPLSLQHSQTALNRVMDGRAPSKPNQQFKDCLIWEVALEEAQVGQLHLVTQDDAFFVSKGSSVMAPELVADTERLNNPIILHRDLESLLAALEQQAPLLDLAAFEEAVLPDVYKVLADHVALHSLRYGRLIDRAFKAFATTEPNELAVSFTFTFEAADELKEDTALNDLIRITGTSRYNVRTGGIRHTMLDVLSYLLHGSEPMPARGANYIYANGWKPSQIVGALETQYGRPFR